MMEKLKKIICFVGLLIGVSTAAQAQKKNNGDFLTRLVGENLKNFTGDNYWEKATVFSVNIGINGSGVVDSVFFAEEENKELNSLVNLQKIRSELVGNNKNFVKYKNTYLILLVLLIKGDEYILEINNGNQLVANWKSIQNNAIALSSKGRNQIFLSPLLIESRSKGIKN